MGIISKITPQQDPNQLGGKPVRVTKFKDGEILAYNRTTQQWEAIPSLTKTYLDELYSNNITMETGDSLLTEANYNLEL